MASRQSDDAQAKRDARNARRRKQTRDEILDVASAIILRDGVSGFKLSSVAEELGLTNPALYYYFRSKEALLFEVILREWFACAEAVEAAVGPTTTGADAVEALLRAVFAHYKDRLDMFTLVHHKLTELNNVVARETDELERIRPVNDRLYGGVESRLREDQRAGVFPSSRDPRRFAFTAHMAAMGLLTMKAITATADDPLIHSDADLVDDLCQTFRYAATAGVNP